MCNKNKVGGLLAAGLLLIGMSTWVLAQEPIDDAYYWPAAESSQTIQAKETKPETSTAQSAYTATTLSEEPAPVPAKETQIEYVNVQDTTVTIRIKK